MFPEILPQSDSHEGAELSAIRLVQLFEQNGYATGFMQELNKGLKMMDEDSFNQIYEYIFSIIRLKFQRELTIFDIRTTSLLDILSSIFNESDELKELFVNLKH